MKKTALILIFLLLGNIVLFAEAETTEDDTQKYKAMIEATLQAQFNEQGYHWEVVPFSVSYKIFKTPLYIGSELIRFSGIEEYDYKKGSLNNYANLSLFPSICVLALTENETWSAIAMIPAAVCLLPNALTNLRLELVPWEDKYFHFFAGTIGDFYLIKDKPELLYSWETGIGLTIGEFRPVCLKLNYSKDIQSLPDRKRQESIGLSFGIRLDLGAAMSI